MALMAILFMSGPSFAQLKTENVVIVTLDGMRWQELFKGVDSTLMNDTLYNHGIDEMKQKFWAVSVDERRRKLFPFVWNTIGRQGQIYGNRTLGNNVDNANPYWFSYPGYNEIFTGYPDTAVNSNDKIYNKNENVLEFINKQNKYKGRVAAFATWDVFPYILNMPRSGVYVNADRDSFLTASATSQMLNDMQAIAPRPIGVRPDLLTYFGAREYLKANKPKVMYVAFDETDDFAHGGMYDQYIGTAFAEDAMIADLWKTLQSMPEYRNKTTLLITVDHGRGDAVKSNWRHHGAKIPDAGQIWMAVIGPDTRPMGEVTTAGTLYQAQVATTIAALLGFKFNPAHPVKPPINYIYE